MLEVRQIHQAFRTGFWLKPVSILQDVSLEVPRGSITGFLGPNGAGKTTLIHLIAGIRRPKSGTITWKGVNMLERRARAQLGYLPERPYFHDHLTGRQLLQYFGGLSGLSPQTIATRASPLLQRVGLSHAGDRPLRTYSKGMLQRIGIAQALIHDPEFLVLDEPMSGLDPVGRSEMKEIILELGREGRTVFFSSHIIPDMEAICDRVAIIHQGRIVQSGQITELLADGSRRIEIRFSASPTPSSMPAGCTQGPDQLYRLTVPAEQLTTTLEGLLRAGHLIVSVEPVHASLEKWFQTLSR